jgi:hypothetical protein
MLSCVTKPEDLETTFQATKDGFLDVAIRRSYESNEYLNQSHAFHAELLKSSQPSDLLLKDDLLPSLCDAAGISIKARKFFTKSDLFDLINRFFEEFIYPNQSRYIDDLKERQLLTFGDALGGRMRNIIGSIGNGKLVEKLVASLKMKSFKFNFQVNRIWNNENSYDQSYNRLITAIQWVNKLGPRTILFGKTSPVVKKILT